MTIFRCSNILEANQSIDDDDGFDTEEFDSDNSYDSPTSEQVQTGYDTHDTQYTTQPVVRIQSFSYHHTPL